jgi:peptide/nickel transport system permease protein
MTHRPLRRLAVAVPSGLLLVSWCSFQLPRLTGVDPASATLQARYNDPNPDPTVLRALRTELGLDASVFTRYRLFLTNAAQGDFGSSFASRLPAGKTAWDAFIVSLQLVVPAVALAVLFGVFIGALSAVGPNSARRPASFVSVVWASFPAHIAGPLAVLLFGITLGWLPTGGWDGLATKWLPIVVLAIAPAAMMSEVVRTELSSAIHAPFVRTAKSKGVGRRGELRHAASVSRHGVLGLGGVMMAGLLSGSVLVETIFSIPGLGRLLVDAVRTADLPVLQAGLLLAAAFSLLVSGLVDACAQWLDPRIRRQ